MTLNNCLLEVPLLPATILHEGSEQELLLQHLIVSKISYITFRYKYFPNARAGVSGFGVAPQSRRTEDRGGGSHNWGQGRRLGED